MSQSRTNQQQQQKPGKSNEDKEKKQRLELLASPRINHVDKITGDVLLPSGDPMPSWHEYPVDKKFPVIPANEGVFGFSRRAIGQDLFAPKKGLPFDINDPHMLETPTGYEPLHDRHLKEYIKEHPELRHRMAAEGLVEEPGGGVKSSMKDWNIYRHYLGKKQKAVLNDGFRNEEELRKSERDQVAQIKAHERHERNEKKDLARKELMDKVREEQEAKSMFAQMRSEQALRDTLNEREIELTRKVMKREALREQVHSRIHNLRKAERKKARRIIIEWYCRQLYADMMRKALREHKKALKEADLDSFVAAKRENQEKKGDYVAALEDKREAENEVKLNNRVAHYEKQQQKVKEKAIEKEDKEKRELEIVRKFAMRWLNFVRDQKKHASTYHDSVWRVRQQLIEMVKGLKNETGRVSFTSFIKGLVKMKPDKDGQMSEETREIMNYILDLLIKAAVTTYKKENPPHKHAYEKQANRRRILGKPDRKPEEYENPPRYVTREKPQIEFQKPTFPCGSVCVGRRKDWEEDPCCKDNTCEEEHMDEAERLANEEMRRLYGDGPKKKQGDESSSGDSSVYAERLSRTALNMGLKGVCKEKGGGESGECKSTPKGKGNKPVQKKGGDTDDGSSGVAERIVTKSLTDATKAKAGKSPGGTSGGKSPTSRSGGKSPGSSPGSGKGKGWGGKPGGSHDKKPPGGAAGKPKNVSFEKDKSGTGAGKAGPASGAPGDEETAGSSAASTVGGSSGSSGYAERIVTKSLTDASKDLEEQCRAGGICDGSEQGADGEGGRIGLDEDGQKIIPDGPDMEETAGFGGDGKGGEGKHSPPGTGGTDDGGSSGIAEGLVTKSLTDATKGKPSKSPPAAAASGSKVPGTSPTSSKSKPAIKATPSFTGKGKHAASTAPGPSAGPSSSSKPTSGAGGSKVGDGKSGRGATASASRLGDGTRPGGSGKGATGTGGAGVGGATGSGGGGVGGATSSGGPSRLEDDYSGPGDVAARLYDDVGGPEKGPDRSAISGDESTSGDSSELAEEISKTALSESMKSICSDKELGEGKQGGAPVAAKPGVTKSLPDATVDKDKQDKPASSKPEVGTSGGDSSAGDGDEDESNSGDSSLLAEELSKLAMNESMKSICSDKEIVDSKEGKKGGDTAVHSGKTAEGLVTKSLTDATVDKDKPGTSSSAAATTSTSKGKDFGTSPTSDKSKPAVKATQSITEKGKQYGTSTAPGASEGPSTSSKPTSGAGGSKVGEGGAGTGATDSDRPSKLEDDYSEPGDVATRLYDDVGGPQKGPDRPAISGDESTSGDPSKLAEEMSKTALPDKEYKSLTDATVDKDKKDKAGPSKPEVTGAPSSMRPGDGRSGTAPDESSGLGPGTSRDKATRAGGLEDGRPPYELEDGTGESPSSLGEKSTEKPDASLGGPITSKAGLKRPDTNTGDSGSPGTSLKEPDSSSGPGDATRLEDASRKAGAGAQEDSGAPSGPGTTGESGKSTEKPDTSLGGPGTSSGPGDISKKGGASGKAGPGQHEDGPSATGGPGTTGESPGTLGGKSTEKPDTSLGGPSTGGGSSGGPDANTGDSGGPGTSSGPGDISKQGDASGKTGPGQHEDGTGAPSRFGDARGSPGTTGESPGSLGEKSTEKPDTSLEGPDTSAGSEANAGDLGGPTTTSGGEGSPGATSTDSRGVLGDDRGGSGPSTEKLGQPLTTIDSCEVEQIIQNAIANAVQSLECNPSDSETISRMVSEAIRRGGGSPCPERASGDLSGDASRMVHDAITQAQDCLPCSSTSNVSRVVSAALKRAQDCIECEISGDGSDVSRIVSKALQNARESIECGTRDNPSDVSRIVSQALRDAKECIGGQNTPEDVSRIVSKALRDAKDCVECQDRLEDVSRVVSRAIRDARECVHCEQLAGTDIEAAGDICSGKLIDEMARAVAVSVLPTGSVSSSYFDTSDGPSDGMSGNSQSAPHGQQPHRTASLGGTTGGIGSIGGGSRGSSVGGSSGGGGGRGGSGGGRDGDRSSLHGLSSGGRLPSDRRDQILRTLSTVQHQLDALRHELRNYGVLSGNDQRNEGEGRRPS